MMKEFSSQRSTLKYMSCWYGFQHESNAMWNSYGNQGLAVRTTIEKLRHSLGDRAQIGMVKYIDYDTPGPYNSMTDVYLFRKRMAFESEREVRAMAINPLTREGWIERPNVVPIAVDLNSLIDRVVISPDAPDWYLPLVRKLVSQLGFDFAITPSMMSQAPSR
jgi:hypothetical protein